MWSYPSAESFLAFALAMYIGGKQALKLKYSDCGYPLINMELLDCIKYPYTPEANSLDKL